MHHYSNLGSDLMQRLLSLLPVETIKSEYGHKGKSDDIYEQVVKGNSADDIMEDCLRLFGHARQHVYLFSHSNKNWKSHDGAFFKKLVHYASDVRNTVDAVECDYLIKLNYIFFEIVSRTADEQKISFLWPVKVRLTANLLEIRIVIMEKDIKSTSQLLFKERDLLEDDLIRLVTGNVPNLTRQLDFNKGIKHMWDKDIIDSRRISHKDTDSVENTVMDLAYTFKAKYPERYKKLIQKPLRKGWFHCIKGKEFPVAFIADPSIGFLAFYRFQTDPVSIDRLLAEIIKHN